MKNSIKYFLVLLSVVVGAQESIDEVLKKYNKGTAPYLCVDDLKAIQDKAIIFDAREKNEYDISHIDKAIHVGYDCFSTDTIIQKNIPKTAPIVVYCSLGIRSEDISEKLIDLGYQKVYNLYGGIFEWKNNNYAVITAAGQVTERVHIYSEKWGEWLYNGIKINSQ